MGKDAGKIRPFFRWFDLWIGAYWDVHSRCLYICPVPMFGVCINLDFRKDWD